MMISHNLTVYVQLHTWFLSLSIRILHRLINLSLKKKKNSLQISLCMHKVSETTQKIHRTMRKKKLNITNKIFFFLPSEYSLDMFHVHLLYTIREILIYITDDYMYCRLALLYIWRMIRVR